MKVLIAIMSIWQHELRLHLQAQRLSLQPLHAPFNSINCLISAATAAAASSLAAKTLSNRPLKKRGKEQMSNLTDLWLHPTLPIDKVILDTLLGAGVAFLISLLPSCSLLSPLAGSWPGRDHQRDWQHLLP